MSIVFSRVGSFGLAPRSILLLAGISSLACTKSTIEPRYAPSVDRPDTMTVTSAAFAQGDRIPVDHTCDGTDVMPALTWSSPPDQTKSLVVYLEDPDASNGTFTHMIAFDIPPDTHTLPAAPNLAGAGEAARFGVNDFGADRYNGPCPPKGEGHRYRFRVVALDVVLKLPAGATRAKVDAASDMHILGEGSLTGHFAR